MERTIDGIDYIAKSEVLRIIDEEVENARRMDDIKDLDSEYRYGWRCIAINLEVLRDRFSEAEGR